MPYPTRQKASATLMMSFLNRWLTRLTVGLAVSSRVVSASDFPWATVQCGGIPSDRCTSHGFALSNPPVHYNVLMDTKWLDQVLGADSSTHLFDSLKDLGFAKNNLAPIKTANVAKFPPEWGLNWLQLKRDALPVNGTGDHSATEAKAIALFNKTNTDFVNTGENEDNAEGLGALEGTGITVGALSFVACCIYAWKHGPRQTVTNIRASFMSGNSPAATGQYEPIGDGASNTSSSSSSSSSAAFVAS